MSSMARGLGAPDSVPAGKHGGQHVDTRLRVGSDLPDDGRLRCA